MWLGRVVAVLLLAVAFAPSARAQSILPPEAVRDRVVAAVRAFDASLPVRADGPSGIRIDNLEQIVGAVSLVNLYQAYTRSPADLDMLVDRMARAITGRIDVRLGAEALVIILRHRDHAAHATANNIGSIARPFAGDLIQLLAFDSPEVLAIADDQTLASAGLSPDEAWLVAATNLPRHIGEARYLRAEDQEGLFVVDEPNGLAPSLLLAPDLCDGENRDAVFLVAGRDRFVMAHKDDAHAVARLRSWAASGQPMSQTILECRDGALSAQ